MVQKDISKKQETYEELKDRLKKSLLIVNGVNENIGQTKQLIKDIKKDIGNIKKINIGCELCANLLTKTYIQKELIETVLEELKNQKIYIKRKPKELKIINNTLIKRIANFEKKNKQYNNIINRLIKTNNVIYSKAIAEVLLELMNKSKKDFLNTISIRK